MTYLLIIKSLVVLAICLGIYQTYVQLLEAVFLHKITKYFKQVIQDNKDSIEKYIRLNSKAQFNRNVILLTYEEYNGFREHLVSYIDRSVYSDRDIALYIKSDLLYNQDNSDGLLWLNPEIKKIYNKKIVLDK